jgi:histidyl-tRNA synthetase
MAAQFTAGERDEVPFAIIIGGDELKAGLVTVKEQRWQLIDGQKTKVESEDKGAQVKRAELVEHIRASQVYQLWTGGKMIDV